MKNFTQFILEKLDSEIETKDIYIDQMGEDDLTAQNLYSTPSNTPLHSIVSAPSNTPLHPIVFGIKKLKAEGGNADLVFKVNHDGTTHTIRIPPVEGDHAKGRIDFTHEITKDNETTTELHELKLSSTPKTAVPKTGKLTDLISKLNLPVSTTLRQKIPSKSASELLRLYRIKTLKSMRPSPRRTRGVKRFLSISTVKDHGLLHPDGAIHKQIVAEIKTLPENKQKLVHQALRLMYERITAHTKPDEKIESEFHSTDLDDKEQVKEIISHLSNRMNFMGRNNVRYISVKTGNQDDHAIIRVDPEHESELKEYLEKDHALESIHPLHPTYMQKIILTGRNKTTIAKSHNEALSIIDRISPKRDKIETNTRVLPK